MAGGPHAKHVPCMECLGDGKLTKAARTLEGVESDQYVCEKGHRFGLDWRKGPAGEPQWPPSEELRSIAKPD